MKSAIFAVPYIFCLYGANLYFSLNKNLNDPIVNLALPLAKDVLWMGLVACSLGVWRQLARQAPKILLLCAAVLIIGPALIIVITWHDGSYVPSYLRTCKNLALYIGAGLLFTEWLRQNRLLRRFLEHLHYALATSLVAGILLFHFSEVQSIDGRMYGTYGNPTSLGVAALFLIALTYARQAALNPSARMAYLAGAFYCIYFSASISVIVSALVFFTVYALLHVSLSAPARGSAGRYWVMSACQYYGTMALVVGVVVVSGLGEITLIRITILLARLFHLDVGPLDSITVRQNDLELLTSAQMAKGWPALLLGQLPHYYYRADSSAVAFAINFGLLGTAALLLPLLIAGHSLFRVLKDERRACDSRTLGPVAAMGALFVLLTLLNLPLQHQYELYPTNFLFCILVACIMALRRPHIVSPPGPTEELVALPDAAEVAR